MALPGTPESLASEREKETKPAGETCGIFLAFKSQSRNINATKNSLNEAPLCSDNTV
jgi:hypothetical protein